MALSKQQIAQLNKIISTAQKLIDTAEAEAPKAKNATRRRRTGQMSKR